MRLPAKQVQMWAALTDVQCAERGSNRPSVLFRTNLDHYDPFRVSQFAKGSCSMSAGPEGSNMEQGLGTKSEEKQTRGWGVPGLDTELSYLQIFEGWPIEEKGISVQFQKLLESKFSLLKKKFFWCWKMQKFFWCCLQMQKKNNPPQKQKNPTW